MYELILKKVSFQNLSTAQAIQVGRRYSFEIFKKMDAGERPPLSLISVSDDFLYLLNRCWHQNPKNRPLFGEVVTMLEAMIDSRREESFSL